jgi:hypothetical protein
MDCKSKVTIEDTEEALKRTLAALRKAKREIERLRAWIEEEGKRTDTCTRNVLGKTCEQCRCGRAVDA